MPRVAQELSYMPTVFTKIGDHPRLLGNSGGNFGLDAWKRDAIAGLGEPRAASAVEARQDRRRVKELERELHRKDKALAETATLLVLSKKLSAVFHEGEDA